MRIDIRWSENGQFAIVEMSHVGARLDIGMLNENERQRLAAHLREVADELAPTEDAA